MHPATQVESCDECAFTSTDYTRDDLLGTLRPLVPMWATTLEGIDPALLGARPQPAVWSAMEYLAHSRDVTAALDLFVDFALSADHPVVEGEPPGPDDLGDPAVAGSLDEALHQLLEVSGSLHDRADAFDDDAWGRQVTWGAKTDTVEWIIGHAVHDATHHLKDVGRGLHALGAGAPSQRGSVTQINTSDGGVPKTPVASADANRNGLVGDRQHDRRNHGRPLQALCLWSEEVIGALQAEGHPIEPGLAGENLTLTGIDWSTIRPGVRMLVGDVSIEISAWATPCAKNAPWFADRDFNRMSHDRNPGWSRAYAWVLEGGTISAGDDVIVEP